MSKSCSICGHVNDEAAATCISCRSSLTTTSGFKKTTMSEKNISSFLLGDLIAHRYEVVSELGRGGMGVVYRVKDTSLRGRETALKMIHPELVANPEARHRFEDEVATCLDLNHPSIIRVYNLESLGDLHFFTMEYLAGTNLSALIESRRTNTLPLFNLKEVESIFAPLLSGLSYAHQYTIHRDLKPDNIMVLGAFPEVEIKILDFGIARTMSISRFTQTAQSMGTPYYMAPEQLQESRKVDHRADIYSVGMILYEMLTGELAVGRFPLPTEVVPDLSVKFDHIIEKTLNPASDTRCQSILEVQGLLSEALLEQIEIESQRQKQQEQAAKLEHERKRQEALQKRIAEEKRVQEELEKQCKLEETRSAEQRGIEKHKREQVEIAKRKNEEEKRKVEKIRGRANKIDQVVQDLDGDITQYFQVNKGQEGNTDKQQNSHCGENAAKLNRGKVVILIFVLSVLGAWVGTHI